MIHALWSTVGCQADGDRGPSGPAPTTAAAAARQAPPPVTGGGLAEIGGALVVADPEGDRLLAVDVRDECCRTLEDGLLLDNRGRGGQCDDRRRGGRRTANRDHGADHTRRHRERRGELPCVRVHHGMVRAPLAIVNHVAGLVRALQMEHILRAHPPGWLRAAVGDVQHL